MAIDNFKRLIRNLRIQHELEELCKKKGISPTLAHSIAFCMFLEMKNLEIAQKYGIHISTVKSYRGVLGSLEESRFKQILNLPKLALLR